LVEKILRLQPNVKKIYLLLRAPDEKSAMQRLRSEVWCILNPITKTLYTYTSRGDALINYLKISTIGFLSLIYNDQQVMEIDLFKVLRNNLGEDNLNALMREKIVPVPGDISIDNLGLKDTDLIQRMWSEIDIIINIAATTNFDERYLRK